MSNPAFVPPSFANIGKSYKDLYKKKFDFDNVLKVVNKTNFGLTLTSSFKAHTNEISAIAKAEYKDAEFGDFEAEADTLSGKVYGKASRFVQNRAVKLTLGGGFDPTSKDCLVKDNWSAKAEADYQKDMFQASVSTLVGTVGDNWAEAVEASGVIGFDGAAVGGQVKLRVDDPQTLRDYNVGAQYEKNAFIFALNTEKKGDIINFNTFYKPSKAWTVGGELSSNEVAADPKQRRVYSFASQYVVDDSTSYKFRVNTLGEVGAVVEHRLANPSVLVSGAASFKTCGLGGFKADKFGVNLSLGDF